MKAKGSIFYCDGRKSEEREFKGKFVSLEEMQEIVGGYIQFVYWGSKIIVIHEEGKLLDFAINPFATAVYRDIIGVDDYIAGNVLIIDSKFVK